MNKAEFVRSFLRNNPKGEVRKTGNGGVKKGATIRPASSSLPKLARTTAGLSIALFKLRDSRLDLSPKNRNAETNPKTLNEKLFESPIIPCEIYLRPLQFDWSYRRALKVGLGV